MRCPLWGCNAEHFETEAEAQAALERANEARRNVESAIASRDADLEAIRDKAATFTPEERIELGLDSATSENHEVPETAETTESPEHEEEKVHNNHDD